MKNPTTTINNKQNVNGNGNVPRPFLYLSLVGCVNMKYSKYSNHNEEKKYHPCKNPKFTQKIGTFHLEQSGMK